MTDDVQPRKLATIVALDVAGYSARTEADATKDVFAFLSVLISIVLGLRPIPL